MIKTLLYVIMYLLAIELFALQKDRCAVANGINSGVLKDGPPEMELGLAKTFPITIMRLPRWKRLIAGSEALKSNLIFLIAFVGYSLL